jgi:hypothetical protein
MRRLTWCALLLLPALLLLSAAPGCSKKEDKKEADKKADKKEVDKKADKKGTATGTKTPVEAGDAVIKGKVVYDGTPPEEMVLAKMKAHEQGKACMNTKDKSQIVEQKWLVNDKKEVANVVVWLLPPEGKYFALKDSDKKPKQEFVVIDQPHCAFVPHVSAIYPTYFDGKGWVKTGQKLKIKNSFTFPHNTSWRGDDIDIKSQNFVIQPKDFKVVEFNYEEKPPQPLEISCQLHTWMDGWILFFDNPYHAVTKADGSFEIKNVPVDVPLTVVAWHEGKSPREFYKKEMTFKKGDNTLDLKISK